MLQRPQLFPFWKQLPPTEKTTRFSITTGRSLSMFHFGTYSRRRKNYHTNYYNLDASHPSIWTIFGQKKSAKADDRHGMSTIARSAKVEVPCSRDFNPSMRKGSSINAPIFYIPQLSRTGEALIYQTAANRGLSSRTLAGIIEIYTYHS